MLKPKKILALLLVISILICQIPLFTALGAEKKAIYNDFNSGLSSNPLPTGNDSNTSFVRAAVGLTYSCSNGTLHLNMTNGNYLRMANTMTGIEKYRYMVVRMKGSYDWENLENDSIAFFFGTAGRYGNFGDYLLVPAEQLTADYSDVVIEIPTGHFDSIADPAYYSDLFITTKRGANFVIDIDEIYFTNSFSQELPEPAPEFTNGDLNNDGSIDVRDIVRLKKAFAQVNENPFYDIDGNGDNNSSDIIFYKKILLELCTLSERGKVYSDFSTELKQGEYVSSGEDDEQIQLFYTQGATYSTENGSLDAALEGERSYLRFINTVPLADTQGNFYYDNLLITLNGYIENSAG